MRGRSIGFVEFRDLLFKTTSRIIVTLVRPDNMIIISLDQNDPDVGGVLGAGDLEVGLSNRNIKQFQTLVQQAISTPAHGNRAWQTVGEAEFSWSDHADQSESGEDYGTILLESNGPSIRMVFRTKKWDWKPYVATFSPTVLNELSALLSRAQSES